MKAFLHFAADVLIDPEASSLTSVFDKSRSVCFQEHGGRNSSAADDATKAYIDQVQNPTMTKQHQRFVAQKSTAASSLWWHKWPGQCHSILQTAKYQNSLPVQKIIQSNIRSTGKISASILQTADIRIACQCSK